MRLQTWPEIAELPRATPLVIPLGEGYDLSQVASALGEPPRVGLLPPFRLAGRAAAWLCRTTCWANCCPTCGSLRDDGFSRVYALCPQGLTWDWARPALLCLHAIQFKPALPLPADGDRDKVALSPSPHEQHGHTLPMAPTRYHRSGRPGYGGDCAGRRRAACRSFRMEVSTHRRRFCRHAQRRRRAFEISGWRDRSAGARGSTGFYCSAATAATVPSWSTWSNIAASATAGIFCATAWLYLSSPMGHRTTATPPFGHCGMGHAGELETALLLHLRPDLVHMERVIDETDFIAHRPTTWIGSRGGRWRPIHLG